MRKSFILLKETKINLERITFEEMSINANNKTYDMRPYIAVLFGALA
jgi:hypothetical protein